LAVALGGCGSDGKPGASADSGGSGGKDLGAIDPTGKSCMGDADCGDGYVCKPAPAGPSCTPDRPCTTSECQGICLAQGQIDPTTGMASQSCIADCTMHGQCCSDPGQMAGMCAKGGGGSGGSGGGGGSGGSGGGGTAIEWAGTWSATVSYTVSCDVAGNAHTGTNNHTLSVAITGANSSLTATPTTPTSGWDPMTGTGSDSGLTISGPFPFRDDTGNTITTTDNSVTIRLTTVNSSTSASGTIEGAAKSRFGARCTISNGTASFTR
jgi:hypothetical protein